MAKIRVLIATTLFLVATVTPVWAATNPGYEGQPGNQSSNQGNPGSNGQNGNTQAGQNGYEGQPGNQSNSK